MSVHEAIAGFEFIYNVLSGDSTLSSLAPGGVWRSLAPPSTPTPFVVMALQAGSDVLTSNAIRVMDSLLYLIKVVGPSSITATIASAAAEIDSLLKRTSGAVSGGNILACWREQPLQLSELINGELWENIGGLYRLEIQQT